MGAREMVDSYLDELRRAGRRENTMRGYRTDLASLVECASLTGGVLDVKAVAAYLERPDGASAATRARRLSALRGLLRWCGQLRLLDEAQKELPVRVSTAQRSEKGRQDVRPADVHAVLATIPRHADRDQLLFGLLVRLGLRPGEALALRIEDFEETNRTLQVPGWGGVRRRVLVDDRQLVLRLMNLKRATGRVAGPMFTAPGQDTPLRYQSALEGWNRYCAAAGVTVHLADLRRLHAEELLAGGVPEAVVRDRLGQRTGPLTGATWHPSPEESDGAIRAWRARATGSEPLGESHSHRGRRAG
ncbi:tyrosine-type recombinase/integrase [Rathayibacter sp. CAU 1779]